MKRRNYYAIIRKLHTRLETHMPMWEYELITNEIHYLIEDMYK